MAVFAIEFSLSCATIVLGVDAGTGVGAAGVAAGGGVAAGELGGGELGAGERALREGAMGTSLSMVGDTMSAAVVGGWVDVTAVFVVVRLGHGFAGCCSGAAVGEDACW